ncbi:cytochrome P450 [Coprinellus micaceus]|uniref:Cytochrome P450 n=1 Tax=Coprinellus micaceus TaxID=71717 RepID=A0A4Y7TKA5_COPMI|nr:cytochrome P450 [Coprinellus micaceus]
MGIELPPAISSALAQLPFLSSIGMLATSSVLKFYNGLKLVSHLPGLRTPFSPYSFLGFTAPVTWWNPGLKFLWEGRKDHYLYKYFGSENFSITPWISGAPLIVSSNLDVLRQTAFGSFRSDFEKPEEMSRALLFWVTISLVLTGRSGGDIAVSGWGDKDTIDIEVVQKLTHKFTLLIISTCGFGLDFDWAEPPAPPDGRMTVQQAFKIVVDRNMAVTFMPRWVHKLVPTTYFREVDEAINEMSRFMKAQVTSRKAAVRSGNGDIDAFTLMVKANEEEGSKYKLNESELIGNVFVLLFAGHETTAVTLAAAMIYLALNPEIEKEVLQNIIEVVGWNGKPTFEDYGKLDKVLAVFLEVLIGCYPSGHLMFRKATKDTTLKLPRPGTMMVIDMVGLQYNPRYFEDPESFKPSRWCGVSKDSDAFTAFSIGPRECIGRKFATVEAVALLALLLRDFKIEPLLLNGETLDAWKTRVLDASASDHFGGE